MKRQTLTILAIAVLIGTFIVPQTAHAALGDIVSAVSGGVGSTASYILGFLANIMDALKGVLVAGINGMGRVLQAFLELKLSYGGPAVYQVWKIVRDTCNMAFLVILILIAFGTIFNVVFPNPFHWRGAIVGLIIAAITINFSLAFGQLIVGLGNELTTVMLGLFNGQNIGANIGALTNLPSLETGQNGILSTKLLPAASGIPLDQLTTTQKNTVSGWLQTAANGAPAPTLALNTLTNCLQNKLAPTTATCFQNAQNIFINEVARTAGAAQQSITNRNLASSAESADYWKTLITTGAGGFSKSLSGQGTTDVGVQASRLLNAALTTFMLLVLALSFLVIIVFMVARLPAVWLLLAISAGAFLTLALPSNFGIPGFRSWFRSILGWSIFSPLYLFAIYLGMYVLSQQTSLVASLAQYSSSSSFIATAAIGQILFFFIACSVFIGGALMSTKFAFGLSAGAGRLFGRIGGALGVSEKTQFGIQTISQQLGIAPRIQAAGERVAQEGRRTTAAIRGRFGIGITNEEALARARRQFGVTGGAQEAERVTRQRIEAQQKTLEAPYKERLQVMENQLNQARTDVERESLRGQIKSFKDQNTSRLKGVMLTSGNQDARLAAGELLLTEGKLSPDELRALGGQYGKISPVALSSFVTRRNEQLMKDAEKRKYNNQAELQSYMEVLGDPKQMEKFLESAQKGKNKIMALEAAGNLKVIERNGRALTGSELINEAAGKPDMNGRDWAGAEEFFHRTGGTMSSEAARAYRQALGDRQKSAAILREIKDADQANRVWSDLHQEGERVYSTEVQIERTEKAMRRLNAKARELSSRLKQAGITTDERASIQKTIDTVEDKQGALRTKVEKLRTAIR